MLELKEISLLIGGGEEPRALLSDVSVAFPRGHFAAILGPSGCGKSTMLKVIAGIASGEEEGDILWKGRNVIEEDFSPSEIGYVPQFSIAHEELTVRECVSYAMRLRVCGIGGDELEQAVTKGLNEVGIGEFDNHLVSVLSGGQRRRLALAMELVSKPAMLLCDEVTSGLDPHSEDEIVQLLHGLSRSDGRVVLSVTHSLQHIDLYDSVLILYQGVVAYHGPPQFVSHYFHTPNVQDLYPQLEARTAKEWAQSWKKHRHEYLQLTSAPAPDHHSGGGHSRDDSPTIDAAEIALSDEPAPIPGLLSQFITLLSRRILIFTRTKAQVALQLGLIFGFPIMVGIFGWNGLPAVKNLSMGLGLDAIKQLIEAKDFIVQSSKIGSLVSGIVMFQVVLLTLMGANNSGREIAAERNIFEKEKLSGLSPMSYVACKAVFLLLLVLAQSLWMGLFVHFLCNFPGELGTQLLLLTLVNAAMTSVCLAVSSFLKSAEQASLVSIYLVGFQLPLSGAVLALPDLVGTMVRPFIAAYWSWSGILQTLKGERYYEIVQMVTQTTLSSASLCMLVLSFHIAVGLFAAWIGCQQRRMS